MKIIGFDTETVLTKHNEPLKIKIHSKLKLPRTFEALTKFCKKQGIDTAEIDNAISLEENFEILGLYKKDVFLDLEINPNNYLVEKEIPFYFKHDFYSAQLFSPGLKINTFMTNIRGGHALFNRDTRNGVFLASNAEFDFSNIAPLIDKSYFDVRCLYNKSRFLYGKITRGKNCWKIYDLRNIFTNWSLAKMGKFLGIEKLEKPSYLGLRIPETAQEKFYFRQYAMRDAEIGFYAGKWIKKWFGTINVTLPSLSFNYFNRKHTPKGLYLKVETDLTAKLRLAYKGGRCESWVRGTPDRKIYAYDVVSLYPSIMLEKPFPVGANGLNRKTTVNLCHDGIALCTVKQDAEIPFLCLKTMCADNNIKLLFPNGTFKAWFTYPELRYFSLNKLGKILKVHEAFETEGCHFYFKSYINEFFDLKQNDKEHGDFWKLCMNSLYGKFAQDAHSPELQINLDNTIVPLEKNGKRKEAFRTNILVSAYITALSRIKMHKYYREIGAENLTYTDTDSIHSFKPFNVTGKGLGELDFKIEGNCTYVRSKFYIFNDMVRCRGMERIFEAKHVRQLIEMNDVTIFSKILLRLRSAYRQHKPFLTEKPTSKHFSLNSDCKRNYQKDLNGAELLTEYALSDAVILNGTS